MPVHGDQYRTNIPNPFEDNTPRISDFTAQEIATLQSRLNKQLGPEYISTRPGAGGGKVAYLAAEKAINLANEVFGFNGWSSSIQQVQVDFVEESATTGKVNLGLSIIVRVTLKDGTFHEDIGYGHIENCKSKAAAFEKAKKEAATDALKRALRTFGNVLGNCLYDKDYLGRVGKLKAPPSKWAQENLHRHPDFAPVKKEIHQTSPVKENRIPRVSSVQSNVSTGTEFEDEFGSNLFDGVDLDEAQVDDATFDSVSNSETIAEAPKIKAEIPPHAPPQQNGLSIVQSNQDSIPPHAQQQISRVQSMPVMCPPNEIHKPPQARPQIQARGPQTPNGLQNVRPDHNQVRILPPQHTDAHHPSRPQPQPQRPPPPQQQPNTSHQPSRAQPQPQPQYQPSHYPTHQQQNHGSRSNPSSASETGAQNQPQQTKNESQKAGPPSGPPTTHEPPIGFVTSRAAELIQKSEHSNAPLPPNVPAFNPHAESPSLRRTSGIDHMKSAPVSRQAIVGGLNQNPLSAVAFSRPNFINPHTDANRRIGMPGAVQSPLANRGAYKPPGPAAGIKRGPEIVARPPLADVSNKQADSGDELNAKRIRVEGAENSIARS
ncbi:hypothetical protein K432DRAFT_390238 [Lepidopterella palustris CBS 459.81]|uniref:RAD52 homolog n=1 Tax=Lepidopterella palustris CBS 459.81 TaxID=1314670 RepID=A0A8E2EGK9_9PEZI|nr:hypothetical protein K432DRAFT_390238 [Lepidopterella palustris CBS 459.81]